MISNLPNYYFTYLSPYLNYYLKTFFAWIQLTIFLVLFAAQPVFSCYFWRFPKVLVLAGICCLSQVALVITCCFRCILDVCTHPVYYYNCHCRKHYHFLLSALASSYDRSNRTFKMVRYLIIAAVWWARNEACGSWVLHRTPDHILLPQTQSDDGSFPSHRFLCRLSSSWPV